MFKPASNCTLSHGSGCGCGIGAPGEPGTNGRDGKDGLDGQPGRAGRPGLDGSSASSNQRDFCFDCPPGPAGILFFLQTVDSELP